MSSSSVGAGSSITPGEPHAAPAPQGSRLRRWLTDGLAERAGRHPGPGAVKPEKTRSWWRVMCLTGVDYFSTLGYQPAIAALAAGLLSPIATVVLVLVTLFGALPVYRRVARESHRGEGSIAMLERLLPWWGGKLVVLVLLGFAATDFMITITLSAADASAHAIENPFAPDWLQGQNIAITLVLILALAVVFLRGFKEAINIAVMLVAVFLLLNAVVIAVAIGHVVENAVVIDDWWKALTTQHGDPLMMIAIALIAFPKLALGLSGFETGVAVMPQIKGDKGDTPANPVGRIRGAKRLLTTAAIIMSTFLITSSITTTLLIPQKAFEAGGPANGRALAYLAHEYLGEGFGTAYDVATIAILWFAGASAMAGLLNLVPRYLPRYGMAPQWAGLVRPLVLVFTAIAVIITLVFRANVDAQAGAYATGVLVLITSASLAVTLSAKRKKQRKAMVAFGIVTVVFVYTTIANIIERPDGVRIAGLFILGIVVVSVVSRVQRSFQLRATSVTFDPEALDYVLSDADEYDSLRIIAHEPDAPAGTSDAELAAEYRQKIEEERRDAGIPRGTPVIFLEIIPSDSSDFEEDLVVHGEARLGYRVLTVRSGNTPNTIASVLLEMRELTGVVPDIYFGWTEGSPISNMFRYLVTGTGEVAPVTREVLRRAEPDPRHRPEVHVS
ncbi:amino acid transporter [Herbiconiux sp. KACC 21604]|uniref:amino acid transporter n=1 Tax=unclassified Herbiconiux TaxID=2618217 RepID=UPI00159A6864|nr:amino acid transporter [Herbiconiux sp. SALV-R1]QJU55360.1 amino acid transporter [Herbiconiux sp. SALV-R1]WPO86531.1 amino acid transporter [Herbiconiux sp. KACC 21604]